MRDPTNVIRDPTLVTGNYRAQPPGHGRVHGADVEPLKTASNFASARRVDAQLFRTLGANFEMARPLVSRDFAARELPLRPAHPGDCHYWPLGVRLGENATEKWAQRINKLPSTPPGFRKAAFREVTEVLRSKGQLGFPPSVATEAHLGFSVMAY